MTTALSLLLIVLLLGLLFVGSISPRRSSYSNFERKRRRQEGIDTRLDDLRERRLVDIESIRRILLGILLVSITLTSIGLFGWWLGAFVTLLTALSYGTVAKSRWVHRFAQKLYNEQESSILLLLQRNLAFIRWLRHDISTGAVSAIDSKQELEHVITGARSILSDDETKLLLGSLRFESRQVHHIMTPKDEVFGIKKTEILGPLVLDDLHKSGHDSFPVTSGAEFDEIVGILRLRDVQTLDTNRRHTAKVETAMDPDVRFVHAGESLTDALHLLLDSQHHMLIVLDDDTQAVVGILTLADIIKSLFGKKD